MLLAIDIGNTGIVIGVFQGDRIRARWRLATDAHKMCDEYAALLLTLFPQQELSIGDIDKAVICSVVPPLETTFAELCLKYFKTPPLIIGAGVRTGVRICTDNPREVGADRVVNAAAAHRLYGGPVIIIDMGTATTFDVVSREGDYLGGVIAPGIAIAAEALFLRTAKLPQVELIRPKHVIGKNTISAIQSGLIFGYVGLIEGIVARLKEELGGDARTVATGGYAELIARETNVIEVVNPDLTLIGLRLIYEMNR